MTTLSLNFRESAFAQETGRVPIALITLDHDDLDEPILISSDPTQRLLDLTTDTEVVYGTISNGLTYIFLPVGIKLPDETEDGPGEMQLEIDLVHRAMTATIRTITEPVTCKLDMVLDNSLDTIEMSWPEMLLTNLQWSAAVVRGSFQLETLETEPFTAGSFTPGYFPGLRF